MWLSLASNREGFLHQIRNSSMNSVTIQVNTSVDAELWIGTASHYITSRLLLPECSILPEKTD